MVGALGGRAPAGRRLLGGGDRATGSSSPVTSSSSPTPAADLTSIVTLLPLGVVVAYLLSHGVWRRLVIVASVVPIAVVGNVARVVITVALVASRGIGYAEGMLHESFGVVTFAVGTLVLLLLARVLR